MISTSKDLLINWKQTPAENSQEFESFWEEERQKCKNGITIDGIFINPFLYWHCNLWTIISDHITKGRIRQKPDFRDSEWLITNKIWEAETWKDEYGNIRKKGVIAAGTRRFSKALEHGSKVYTKDCEISIEDVKEGDLIFGGDGKLTAVTGVFPQGVKDIYEITLLDGRKLHCCEDHLWYLSTKKTGKLDRKGEKFVTLSTKELISKYKKKRKNSHKPGEYSYEHFYSIPKSECVEYDHKLLPIDPYFLGLWLGDGSSKGPDITSIDDEIKDYVKKYADKLNLKVFPDGITYRITSGVMGGNNKKLSEKNILLTELRNQNLIHNKHIPKEYLYSSKEQRIELLKGLMDSDGTISTKGDCSFTTSIPELAKDFYFLCRSLGINLKETIKKTGYKKDNIKINCKDSHNFQLYIDFVPFSLTRKIERFKIVKGDLPKINKSKIINIEKVRENYATCITVDNKDKLFLTDNFTITHNSEIEASFCAWKACNWRNSQVLVSGLNEPDIKIITDKIDLGINELPNYWVKSKVEDNWKKQVSLGHKDAKTGERNIYSSFAIRNFDGGSNEEALAGLTPSGGVIDEGGKGPFLKALLAGLPGLSTPSGWRGTFLVMGTGGDMENFKDFQTLFDDPEQYNFLSCEIPDENRKGGLFLPGHMSYAYPKIQSNLADHINVDPKKYPNLAKIKIVVSDKEVNNATIDKERVEKSRSQDPSALLKHMMYFPKNSREMFMSVSNNNFPLKAAENHQLWVRENFEPEYIDLYRDEGNRVQSKYSELRPISKYPVNATDFKEAPVVLYERPQDLPYGTYCMGVDAYNKNDSSDKVNSLGSLYIFKRMYDPLGEFQNSIVASYSGRPAEITTFYQIALNLCEYYGAICLPETNERFIDFFVNKKKGNLIHDSVQLARDINPLTSIRAPKGLNPSVTNQKYYMELEVQYTTEELEHGDGNKIGIVRILDPMLLEEMIQYRSKSARTGGVHDINCDRIVAFGHCLVLAQHMDKYAPLDSWKPRDKEQVFKQDPAIKSFFGTLHKKNTGPFKSISDIPVRPKNNGMRFI